MRRRTGGVFGLLVVAASVGLLVAAAWFAADVSVAGALLLNGLTVAVGGVVAGCIIRYG